MIQIIDKTHAKLVVEVGKGTKRRRRAKTITYKGKRDLQNQYDAFREEAMQTPLTNMTVDELVDKYIKSRKTLGIKATTLRGYEVSKERIAESIGRISAKDCTPFHVQDFVTEMSAKYSTKTIANTIGLLKAAYNEAIRLEQLNSNPCLKVTMPKVQKPEITVFTNDEIRKFIALLDKERIDFRVAYKLALFCGLRRSEILGLREDHINLPFRTIKISDTRHRVDGKNIVQDTKTMSSYRTLSIPNSLAEEIEELIEKHHSLQYEHSDYLIQDGFGKPMNPSNLTTKILRIEKENGLPNVSLHDLRHTFATLLINAQKFDIAQISAELGHSNVTTTLNRYTHVFNGATASSKGIANLIDARFGADTALGENKKTAEA